jgi:hypothetical protein
VNKKSAKVAAARRQGAKQLAAPFGGALDTATVLRVFLRRSVHMAPKPGPCTAAGKQNSSRNSWKHGMTSQQLVAPGEDPQDLDALLAEWLEAYPPDGEHARGLVESAVKAEWLLRRVETQFHAQSQVWFATEMKAWSKETHHEYQLANRYLTAAQRTLDRARRTIWQYRGLLRAEAREERCAMKEELLESKRNPKPPESYPPPTPESAETLHQKILVDIVDGVTRSFFVPKNDELLKLAESRYDATPVQRALVFRNGIIPPEYKHFPGPMVKHPDGHLMRALLMSVETFRLAVGRQVGPHLGWWPDLLENL